MTNRWMSVTLFALIAAGCGKDDGFGSDECGEVIRKMIGDGPKGDGFAKLPPDEQEYRKKAMAEAGKAMGESCRKEKWSKELIDCYKSSSDARDASKCDRHMTDLQRDAAEAAMKAGADKVEKPESMKKREADELAKRAEVEREREEAAKKIVEESQKDAAEAKERVEKLEREAEEMSKKLDEAIAATAAAQDKADLEAAKAKLAQLQKEQAEMKAAMADAKAKAARAERVKGSKVSKECQENPLAKGCM